jgi:hypothetical protein
MIDDLFMGIEVLGLQAGHGVSLGYPNILFSVIFGTG